MGSAAHALTQQASTHGAKALSDAPSVLASLLLVAGEWFAQKILPVLHPILPEQKKAIFTATVAEAIMANAEFALALDEKKEGQQPSPPSVVTLENAEIRQLKVARV